ncbi:hypothetical protein J4N45_10830 [Vibrio sp. SCSIO 43140]|uniref:hypothetical protein n=1 Tax=Vibrio sp. SCSIO 43140 TaxID=2819100 RepID=UPI00207569B4|nr:hypothetical protein [Vibrio sp. SCSIO 43140]USD59024.1 hypothetical protein J4N45_10830 [Vibrio sp. SCSIO 43140]
MSKLVRVHRCIKGVPEQYYSRDKDEIDRLKKELSMRVSELTFPWGVNTVKRKDADQTLPQTMHIKVVRKTLNDGSVSEYRKVIIIIDRPKLKLYKTFSRRFGTTHTFEQAIEDVIARATAWWNDSEYASSGNAISTYVVKKGR